MTLMNFAQLCRCHGCHAPVSKHCNPANPMLHPSHIPSSPITNSPPILSSKLRGGAAIRAPGEAAWSLFTVPLMLLEVGRGFTMVSPVFACLCRVFAMFCGPSEPRLWILRACGPSAVACISLGLQDKFSTAVLND